MTTITIKQHGDVVYYLTSKGFEKGQVKRTLVVSEIHESLSIKYFVNDDITDIYMGHEREPNEVWDSYEEMLNHFQSNPSPIKNFFYICMIRILWLRRGKRVLTPHGIGTIIEISLFNKNVLVNLDYPRGVHSNFYYTKSELQPL